MNTSNYIDPATARALADVRRMIQDAKKILNDITDRLGIEVDDTQDGLMETYELSATNADDISDCRTALEELYETIIEE